jgi:MATE family multidrug resistance protein
MLYALTGWFFGRQNAMIPLAITVSINVMNMVISYVLVQTYGLNIAGVAWGTVVSQYAGVMMMMLIVITKYDYSIRRLFRSRITIAMGQFFSVNRDLFIRTILLTLSFAILYRYSNRLGALELAANVVILQLLNWISFGVDGFAYAAESVVGKYMGRKDSKKVLDVVRLCIYWGGAIALIYTLLFLCASGAIVGLYTLDLAVSNHISMLKPWVVALPLISFVCYIFDGIFIGLLESKLMRDSMIISFGVFMLSMSFLSHNNVILWSSFCVFLLLRGLVQIYYWHQKIKVRLMRS